MPLYLLRKLQNGRLELLIAGLIVIGHSQCEVTKQPQSHFHKLDGR